MQSAKNFKNVAYMYRHTYIFKVGGFVGGWRTCSCWSHLQQYYALNRAASPDRGRANDHLRQMRHWIGLSASYNPTSRNYPVHITSALTAPHPLIIMTIPIVVNLEHPVNWTDAILKELHCSTHIMLSISATLQLSLLQVPTVTVARFSCHVPSVSSSGLFSVMHAWNDAL